jgi:hypothetical protein
VFPSRHDLAYAWDHLLNPNHSGTPCPSSHELHLPLRQGFADRHPQGQADEVCVLKFDPGALIAVVE